MADRAGFDGGAGDAADVAEPDLQRGWRSIMFAPVGDGQRRRRGSDGAGPIGAVLILLSCALIMILGLTAAGVRRPMPPSAVFIQRLFTSYLPPIWGWITLVGMRKREYL